MTAHDPAQIADYERTWKIGCWQCGEIGTCTFTNLDDEREAALNLYRLHHGHGLGGYMTPVKSDG